MPSLLQFRLDPQSRLIRLMLGEYGVAAALEDIRPWRREPALLDLNPAAETPILLEPGEPAIVGVLASLHHVEVSYAPAAVEGLVPAHGADRSEMWRLLQWVLVKFNDEVTRYVLEEKFVKRDQGSGAPDPAVLRAAKANMAEHMAYFAWLLASRRWLGGEHMSLADFALAAHLSVLDYMGDIAWDNVPDVKTWYARMKSRPAFRPLLADRVAGMPAAATYADLDF